MTKKIFQPTINCGYLSGELPMYFTSTFGSFVGFETEEECDKWIEDNMDYFNQDELGGCVYSQEYEVENPTIINADGDVVC